MAASGNSTKLANTVAQQLTETLGDADDTATRGAQMLQQVHQARLAQANRTVDALTKQLGNDDPQVKAAKSAAAATEATALRIAALRQQMTTPVVQVPQKGWVMQGRVLDATYHPLARYTVFFVDAQRAFQRQYGFAYTDDSGYFELGYAGDGKATSGAASALFIEVADTNASPVYLGTTPFTPVAGAAMYQNIVIPAGDQSIGDPPSEIRDIAIPKTSRTKHPSKGSAKKT